MQIDDPVELIAPKGLPPGPREEAEFALTPGQRLFDAGLHWPVAVIKWPTLLRNSRTMAEYCARHGMSLAPHGKTTMTPAIFALQMEHGAWAITAATVWQARIMKAAGVPRVLIANEVVAAPELEWFAAVLGDPAFEVLCYVDSVAGVEMMDRGLSAAGASRPLPVLVELGVEGGRTGVRTVEEGLRVAAAAAAAENLTVVGVSGFEGIIGEKDGISAESRVRAFLADLHLLASGIEAAGGFGDTPEVLISAGGSAYFDLVVEEFAKVDLGRPVRSVVRSGNYLTHADGGYEHNSPMGSAPRLPKEEGRLHAAMEVWGVVLSRPEPTRAIVGVGKRDISPDNNAPVVRGIRDTKGAPRGTIASCVSLNDQHAYLDVPADSLIAVGDLVAFGTPHACTTFDKWRTIVLVDDDYAVQQVVRTYF
jgi:D-serine deaminase-like pyridoxal phosphate-dependent protein